MNIIVEMKDKIHYLSWNFNLTTQEEIILNEVWNSSDDLLDGLSNTAPFIGKTKWRDLDLEHYQILTLQCFTHLEADQDMSEMSIRFKEPFSSFRFFASAIVKILNQKGISGFNELYIERVDSETLYIDVKRSFEFSYKSFNTPVPAVRTKLKIVVDNSDI